jgi:hypothetical protein
MKRAVLLVAVLVGVTMLPTTAQATAINTGDVIKVVSVDGTLGGGPFGIDGPDAGPALPADFMTFCLELDESVVPNASYHVKLSNAAEDGGLAGPNPDPISEQTAFLYSNYVLNTLGAYGYTGDQTSKDALQLAIWFFEQEVIKSSGFYIKNDGGFSGVGNPTIWAKTDQLIAAANSNYQLGNFYDVQVMQLWTTPLLNLDPNNFDADSTNDTNVQDMLVFVPEGGSTLAVLMMGLVAVGAAGTRLRRVA